MSLFTFGYEGLSVDQFVRRLREAGVQLVFDVRQHPLSRKPGFSKTALAMALEHGEIGYEHIAALGCPRDIRDRYKSDGDWPAYARAFRSYLATQRDAVARVAEIAADNSICLVCFEADHTRCHRSLVALAAMRLGVPATTHLSITKERPGRVRQAA